MPRKQATLDTMLLVLFCVSIVHKMLSLLEMFLVLTCLNDMYAGSILLSTLVGIGLFIIMQQS